MSATAAVPWMSSLFFWRLGVFVAFAIDDAAYGAIAYVYVVRRFSLAFDLDQQSIG
jgi:hypothetical protein